MSESHKRRYCSIHERFIHVASDGGATILPNALSVLILYVMIGQREVSRGAIYRKLDGYFIPPQDVLVISLSTN
jgi:hypothetical protein